MISNKLYFEIAFSDIPNPVENVWIMLSSFLDKNKCLPSLFYLSQIAGHPDRLKSEDNLKLSPKKIHDIIIERKLNGFHVDTGHSERSVAYSLSHMKNSGRQSTLDCRISSQAKAPNDWNRLIEVMMIQSSCIGAWQWTHLYRVWQWVSTAERYAMVFGEIPSTARTYIEKSPCVLSPDKTMIDITSNPGRFKELLTGVRFYPTAEMWLGPHFWQYAECKKEEALAADFWLETRDTPYFTYLKCWPKPFSRPDGEQGRMQQRLWNLFFHEDCEWPPGSGGISDEPVYGPHALMP